MRSVHGAPDAADAAGILRQARLNVKQAEIKCPEKDRFSQLVFLRGDGADARERSAGLAGKGIISPRICLLRGKERRRRR